MIGDKGMPKSSEIEVKVGNQWKRLHVTSALARNERYGRCVNCKNPARAHSLGKNGAAAHVEHLKRSRACNLSDHRKF